MHDSLISQVLSLLAMKSNNNKDNGSINIALIE